jgi:calcitonin receptor-like
MVPFCFFYFQFVCFAQQCRSKFGIFQPEDFDFHACVWCYFFLYPENVFKPHHHQHYLMLTTNSSKYPAYSTFKADIKNSTLVDIICSSLTPDECDRWKLCCETSHKCCRSHAHSEDFNDTCAPTWDGFGCWGKGTPGQISSMSCPVFLPFAIPTSNYYIEYTFLYFEKTYVIKYLYWFLLSKTVLSIDAKKQNVLF